MILTNCAACAAPLPRPAKQCSRCKTLYCGPACQKQHWKCGGHDALCKKIKKGGGAEQYHADKKNKEAVVVAVEKCADDTKGQKCYICLEAVHSRTGEGLVRGCACGDRDGVSSPELGVAHVTCLARQAKIAVEEAEENNLGVDVWNERFGQWITCSLCEHKYHGVVRCALGWACWKTYVGRPETDQVRCLAMNLLGLGLTDANHHEAALSVMEALLDAERRSLEGLFGGECILPTQANIARCYMALGRLEETVAIEREVYARSIYVLGPVHEGTLTTALNLISSLVELGRHAEAKALGHEHIPQCRRALGSNHKLTLSLRLNFAEALFTDPTASRADVLQAVAILEDVTRGLRRVLGNHPDTTEALRLLEGARMKREDVAAP